MKEYRREDPLFALCGLNCALCPMYVGGYCPGCGGGAGNQPCAIVRCSREHGAVEHCYECAEFPCPRYRQPPENEVFVPNRDRTRDLLRARRDPPAYRAMLEEKQGVLQTLLGGYNDGRRKTLFCLAVYLLELEDLRAVMARLEQEAAPGMPLKEKAALAADSFQSLARRQGVILKLNKKPKRKE